jgi:hypothetical protein
VRATENPRVRINGRLNQVLREDAEVSWCWRTTSDAHEARQVEAALIAEWRPPWNRTRGSC